MKDSKIADLLQSNWVRWGSALYAAAFLREFVGENSVGPHRHRRAGVQRRRPVGPRARPAGPASPSRRSWRTPLRSAGPPTKDADRGARRRTESLGLVELLAQLLLAPLLLPPVVLAHPRRDPDERGVIARHAVAVGELVCPVHRWHPAAGPLSVVRDEQQRHVRDRGARLDETLDSTPRPDELEQVFLVGIVGRAAAAATADRSAAPAPRRKRSSRPMGTSVLYERSPHTRRLSDRSVVGRLCPGACGVIG